MCLLLGCQRMVDPALFAETGSYVEVADDFFEFLVGIGRVGVQDSAFIFLLVQDPVQSL